MNISKSPVSVCIIAGNEAARISRALESVADWVSEIIVVINDDVHDGTDKIAESYGAKVFREPWKGFIGQKNSVLAKAGQPWVLNLDADEEVPPALRDEIAAVTGPAGPPHASYEFSRCTFYCGRWIRHGDWYPDRVHRLWRRGLARWGGEEPHAKLEIKESPGRLHADLQHYFTESLNDQINKIAKFSDDFARQHAALGKTARLSDLLLRPPWRFIRSYLFRLGFLDGWQGCYIAWMTAFYTAIRYAKALAAQSKKTSNQ